MKVNNETKIGIFVSVVVLALFVLTVKTGDFHFGKKGYNVRVVFNTIDGVSLNAPVMLNGFEVGVVKDIHINDDEKNTTMELDVWLSNDIKLRQGTKARVKNMGFMGEKYIGLTSSENKGAYLKPGDTINGERPADLDLLLTDGQIIAEQLKEISVNLNARLTKNEEAIDSIFKNMDITMKNMVSISGNVDERLLVNSRHIDDTIGNFHSMSKNLDEFSYDLKMNPWKLMYRPKK